jgi:hypothetical protein
MEEVKQCRYVKCQKVLIRGEAEQTCNWKARETCNKRCAARQREVERKQKGLKYGGRPAAREPPVEGAVKPVGTSDVAELLHQRRMQGALK